MTQQTHGNKGREGFWNDRRSYKRAVADLEVFSFIGWKVLVDVVEAANNKDRYSVYDFPFCSERDKGLVSTAFLSGGRITEVCRLRKSMFTVDDEWVNIKNMPLLKRKRPMKIVDHRTGETVVTTKPIPAARDVSFRRNEPLAEIVVQWIDYVKDYLFPSHRRRGHFPYMTIQRAWQIVDNLSRSAGYIEQITNERGKPVYRNGEPVTRGLLWPHRLRSERASQLAKDYGFDIQKLMKFFGWTKPDTAVRYAHRSTEDLKAAMPEITYAV